MYNGVNDENNESSFNSDENLYHYSCSKDQAPARQPDPSQTSWQPAPPGRGPGGAGGSDLLPHRRLSG